MAEPALPTGSAAPAESAPSAEAEPVANVRRIAELAADHADEIAYTHLAVDGSETAVTWAELHRRSSQVAAALAARGVGFGDRVGLGIRNSVEFVVGVLAT